MEIEHCGHVNTIPKIHKSRGENSYNSNMEQHPISMLQPLEEGPKVSFCMFYSIFLQIMLIIYQKVLWDFRLLNVFLRNRFMSLKFGHQLAELKVA